MTIRVRNSTVVRPSQDTPARRLWISDLDLLVVSYHVQVVYFYKRPGDVRTSSESDLFFDANVLKDALGRALVHFYPLAGRFTTDKDGRSEINCNTEGVLFVEADTVSSMDDFAKLPPTLDPDQLVPEVDTSKDISSYPLLVVQVTYFKCGGVSLGVGMHHTVADGTSRSHFVKTWSEIARGLQVSVAPFLDRTVLLRSPNPLHLPAYAHTEYTPPPVVKSLTLGPSDEVETSFFKLTKDQMDALKAKSNEEGKTRNFSSYVILAAHVWRSVCEARELLDDRETRLIIPTDGRSRLQPHLPLGYFGNVVFRTISTATVGDLKSKPLRYGASRVHDAIARSDGDYLQSALNCLATLPNIKAVASGAHYYKNPNLLITSWVRMPIYEADFGWGRPMFVRPCRVRHEGLAYVLPSPTNDGSLTVAIGLQRRQMKLFVNFFYDI